MLMDRAKLVSGSFCRSLPGVSNAAAAARRMHPSRAWIDETRRLSMVARMGNGLRWWLDRR